MKEPPINLVDDVRGLSRLAIEATTGITDIVESMHRTIQRVPSPVGKPVEGRTRGVTGLVYRSIRGITEAVGSGLDLALSQRLPLARAQPDTRERVYALGVLNAVLGDYLETSHNPLAVRMSMCAESRALPLSREDLSATLPGATGKLLLFVHGLGLNDQWWESLEPSYGKVLAETGGYTPLYLRYNSGRHVSLNGRQLAEQLETLISCWPVPVEQLTLVGYSMGGLVARSAVHYAQGAGRDWLRHLRHLVLLGTPHHGAPLEQGGSWVHFLGDISPYSAPIARLARVRSAGITDLRHGNLLDSDWLGRDRFARGADERTHVPLPDGVGCYAIAGSLGSASGLYRAVGDGLVPVDSALGRHPDPERSLRFADGHTHVVEGVDHLGLLCSAAVLAQLGDWLAGR